MKLENLAFQLALTEHALHDCNRATQLQAVVVDKELQRLVREELADLYQAATLALNSMGFVNVNQMTVSANQEFLDTRMAEFLAECQDEYDREHRPNYVVEYGISFKTGNPLKDVVTVHATGQSEAKGQVLRHLRYFEEDGKGYVSFGIDTELAQGTYNGSQAPETRSGSLCVHSLDIYAFPLEEWAQRKAVTA